MIGLIIVYWLDIAEVGKMQNMQYAGYLSHYVYPRYGSRRVSGLWAGFAGYHPGRFPALSTGIENRCPIRRSQKFARAWSLSSSTPEKAAFPLCCPKACISQRAPRKGKKFPLLKSDLKVLFRSTHYGKRAWTGTSMPTAFSVIVGLRPETGAYPV